MPPEFPPAAHHVKREHRQPHGDPAERADEIHREQDDDLEFRSHVSAPL